MAEDVRARRFASDMESIGIKVTVRELTWDEYLCQFSKDEQGRLLWRGKVVKSALRETK